MADLDFHGAGYGAEPVSRLGDQVRGFGWANWAGAATSLALTGTLAVWAMDLAFRDVSSVPVIAALEGPMREAPADPGGAQAPFQGMALSDITSGGAAAPAPDEIVLAPDPVELAAAPLSERRAAAAEMVADPVADALLVELPEPASIAAPAPQDFASLVNELIADPEKSDIADLVPARASRGPVYSGPGLSRSERPSRRPADLRRAAAPATLRAPTDAPDAGPGTQVASLAPLLPARIDVDPASVLPGMRVVQLGAYDSEAAARTEWDRLSQQFRGYMQDKRRFVQRARSGGRDFWRLRVVGFDDAADARRFCSALLAKDATCIPVTVR